MKKLNYLKLSTALTFSILLFSCTNELEPQPTNSFTDVEENFDQKTAVLIDASHDGGGWWFPQSDNSGFSADQDHQGKALADYLRELGYTVTEVGRGTKITSATLGKYDKVIRAGKFGTYSESELKAYEEYVSKGASLILISEYLRHGARDKLAEQLGITFIGMAKEVVSSYADHPITKNANPMYYNAGSVILDTQSNKNIEVLGWLPENTLIEYQNGRIAENVINPEGVAVMGILHHPQSKIFFIGDINCLESMPQPLVSNLVQWAFE